MSAVQRSFPKRMWLFNIASKLNMLPLFYLYLTLGSATSEAPIPQIEWTGIQCQFDKAQKLLPAAAFNKFMQCTNYGVYAILTCVVGTRFEASSGQCVWDAYENLRFSPTLGEDVAQGNANQYSSWQPSQQQQQPQPSNPNAMLNGAGSLPGNQNPAMWNPEAWTLPPTSDIPQAELLLPRPNAPYKPFSEETATYPNLAFNNLVPNLTNQFPPFKLGSVQAVPIVPQAALNTYPRYPPQQGQAQQYPAQQGQAQQYPAQQGQAQQYPAQQGQAQQYPTNPLLTGFTPPPAVYYTTHTPPPYYMTTNQHFIAPTSNSPIFPTAGSISAINGQYPQMLAPLPHPNAQTQQLATPAPPYAYPLPGNYGKGVPSVPPSFLLGNWMLKPTESIPSMPAFVYIDDSCKTGDVCDLEDSSMLFCPDLRNGTRFFVCTPSGWVAQECPAGLHFAGDRCDAPAIAATFIQSSIAELEMRFTGRVEEKPVQQETMPTFNPQFSTVHPRLPVVNRINYGTATAPRASQRFTTAAPRRTTENLYTTRAPRPPTIAPHEETSWQLQELGAHTRSNEPRIYSTAWSAPDMVEPTPVEQWHPQSGGYCSLLANPKNQIWPDLGSSDTFYMCIRSKRAKNQADGQWTRVQCPVGTLFDPFLRMCDSKLLGESKQKRTLLKNTE